MKMCLYITTKPLYRWPSGYWSELIRLLLKDNHNISVLVDDSDINLKFESPDIKVYKDDEITDEVIGNCEVYIGPPLKYSEKAKSLGLEIINFAASVSCQDSIETLFPCKYCLNRVDTPECLYGDEFCWNGITPLMVMNRLDEICRG